jgi:hypothetical protein
MAERDEFFVGYAAAPPPGVARVVRRAVLVLACVALAVPILVVVGHTPLAPATFEFGVTRSFRGTIRETPVAALVVARQGDTGTGAHATSSFLLVAPGKHGAAELVRGRDGQSVELSGTLVYRDGRTMIEVQPDSIAATSAGGDAVAAAATEDLGEVRLRGEIVDTKCHLGVMNPGDGKTHRQCAARCISGGVPPALRVHDASGATRLFLLVGPAGESVNHQLLPFVAEPVEIAGRAERRGDLLVLYAAPAAIRRLGEES